MSPTALSFQRLSSWVLATLLLAVCGFAQDAIGPFVSTVGTTVRDNGGRDWGYVLWTANSPTLLNGRTHAVYAKPGDANSSALFRRVSIVSLQTESITLGPLLARAAALGEDTNTLRTDIDALFGKFTPATASLPEKLSAAVRGALIDERHYGRLVLLARAHPSVAMAMGSAHAELIGAGQTTFEIREFDRATGLDGAVIGRVTVTAGSPTILPAPGIAVELPQMNARGHLNAQLRWSVPDPLRRLSLLQHGYNLWRVRDDYATSRGWHGSPPTAGALATGAGQSSAVRKLNQLPIIVSKSFTAAQAANVMPPSGDTNTFFFIDDNDRGRSNVVSSLDFTNGARFYYFVTARDILGRDGLVSPGTLVQICDKLPPDAVRDVDVLNDFTWQGTSNRFRLRVAWPQAPNLPLDEERIRAYWVYRWTNITELRALQANRSNNLIAVVNHIPGMTTNSYLDASPGAPSAATHLGKTFWYTVRAEDSGFCGGNLAPHSTPAFGVLRDRVGPAAPTGSVVSACFAPNVDFINRVTNGNANVITVDESFQFTIAGLRLHSRMEWMELKAEVRPAGSSTVAARYSSGRRYFSPMQGGHLIVFPFDVPGDLREHEMFITAIGGFGDGSSHSSGAYQVLDSGLLKGDVRVAFAFTAGVQEQAKNIPCDNHYPTGPNDTLIPIEVSVQPTATSKELRIYRRVDDGPLELIHQRVLSNLAIVTIPDDTFPHGGGRVCYFASTFDEHGNASAMTRLGCRYAFENAPPPQPQLSAITPLGPSDAPQMLLSWFCPSANIERFEVGIAALGSQISSNCAPGYLTLVPPSPVPEFQSVHPELVAADGIEPLAIEFRRFITPTPGGNFGQADRFVVPVDIELGRHYIVYVKSVARSGARSVPSNLQGYTWRATNAPQPQVPWPARSLPPVGNSFGLDFDVSWMFACGATSGPTNPAVRISFFGFAGTDVCPERLNTAVNPNAYIPTNSLGESLFPLVLFRQQVPNSDFPSVSGDVVQVSPMMEAIAWGTSSGQTVIYDPFILVQRGASAVGRFGMYLRDTQPIISNARYRYMLVRFNKLGEIAEIIPAANEIEVP